MKFEFGDFCCDVDVFIPHHIDRVKLTSYVEYNGEY